jgi:hypothetical protein
MHDFGSAREETSTGILLDGKERPARKAKTLIALYEKLSRKCDPRLLKNLWAPRVCYF